MTDYTLWQRAPGSNMTFYSSTWHFFRLRNNPSFSRDCNTWFKCCKISLHDLLKTRRSSRKRITHRLKNDHRTSFIININVAGASIKPKPMTRNWNCPKGMLIGRFWNILLLDSHLVVARFQVQLWKNFGTPNTIKQALNVWKTSLHLGSNVVQCPPITNKSQRPIRLLDKNTGAP